MLNILRNHKWLRRILILYVAIASVFFSVRVASFVYFILVVERVITSGQYRGIEIGWSRSELVNYISSPGVYIMPHLYTDGGLNSCGFIEVRRSCGFSLEQADEWWFRFPGPDEEIIIVTFEEDRITQIQFNRNWWPVI